MEKEYWKERDALIKIGLDVDSCFNNDLLTIHIHI